MKKVKMYATSHATLSPSWEKWQQGNKCMQQGGTHDCLDLGHAAELLYSQANGIDNRCCEYLKGLLMM
jgi:hypothetical protein